MKAREILLDEARCYELVVPAARLREAAAAGAGAPGSVRRYGTGAVLHTAPGRWLLVGDAIARESSTIVTAQAHGGALIDVSGKWLRLSVTGESAGSHLSQFLALERVLHARDCAPVGILDCPTLLARCERGFELWTPRSWAAWLRESLSP